ncbi:hypothetical protein QWZ04_17245 [Vibrio tapetis subsp. quintayensis]|uniref:hypothetical protein n=1 Tax=Vibrio tapetis TaxID=52443 RepID=UPI0025B52715|nr:hypothetical protein [Vibrio tapetis]MDN3682053.1 hypothetical protein [Vibrio tapetis subsp. quintayensis]
MRTLTLTLIILMFNSLAIANELVSFKSLLNERNWKEIKKYKEISTNIDELTLGEIDAYEFKYFSLDESNNIIVIGSSQKRYYTSIDTFDINKKGNENKFSHHKVHLDDALYLKGSDILSTDHSRDFVRLNIKDMEIIDLSERYKKNEGGYFTSNSRKKIKKITSNLPRFRNIDDGSWVKELDVNGLMLYSGKCKFTVIKENTVEFVLEKCKSDNLASSKKRQVNFKLLDNGLILVKTSKFLYIIDKDQLEIYSREYSYKKSIADRLEKEVIDFTNSIDFDIYDKSLLRDFSKEFPDYLARQELETQLAKHFNNLSDNKYGLKVLKTVKKSIQGERRVPSVRNSYYTTEDQSYYINGEYINKTRSIEKIQHLGGYEESIESYELVFAIDNTQENIYVAQLEATWSASEYYYEKESYCMKRGLIFCKQWGNRNVRKERNEEKRFLQDYLIGPNGRAKHSFELGEREPNDLRLFISNIRIVDNDIFQKFDFVMSEKGKETPLESYKNIKHLKSLSEFSEFEKMLTDRKKTIEQYHLDQFSKSNIEKVTIQVNVDSNKFDKDFENDVVIKLQSSDLPLVVEINTPIGDKLVQVSRKKSGVLFIDECLLCQYQGEITLEGIKNLSLEELKTKVKIIRVMQATDK